MTIESGRDYALDNLRFALIFSVVFAHLLEICTPSAGKDLLYQGIYAFHMPAFLFLFGYNARFSAKRIVFRWLVPYAVFQTLYTCFRILVLKDGAAFQYAIPYWILWYMLVCVYYQALLPVYDKVKGRGQVFVISGAFVLSLLVGYVDFVGYPLSLSRFFVFLPWFLLGHSLRKSDCALPEKARIPASLLSICVIILSVPFLMHENIPDDLLYASSAYSVSGGTVWMRLAVSLIALSWICFLFFVLKPRLNRKIPLLTSIGQNTWPIFLLHGFIVKALPVVFPEFVFLPRHALVICCAVLVMLGNRVCSKAIYYGCFLWMERFCLGKNITTNQ